MLTLVDYYADWCGPCQQMKPVMKELEEELAGKLEFAELDVDDPANQAKVQGAGVMSIPTFIIEKDGEEVDRKLGAMPKDAMMQWIQQCLEA